MLTNETARPKRRLILSWQTLRRLDPVLHSIDASADGKKSQDGGATCTCNCKSHDEHCQGDRGEAPDPERPE